MTWAIAGPHTCGRPRGDGCALGRERSLPREAPPTQRPADAIPAAGQGRTQRQRQDDDRAAVRATLVVTVAIGAGAPVALAARLVAGLALVVAGRAVDVLRARRVGLVARRPPRRRRGGLGGPGGRPP